MRSFAAAGWNSGRRARLAAVAALLTLAIAGWTVVSLAGVERTQAQAVETATLTIEKVNLNNGGNGDGTEVFTGTYSGPVTGNFSVSANSAFSVSVPVGTYTITEDPPAGSTYVGGFTYLDERFLCNAVDAPEAAVAGPVAITLVADNEFPRHVCLVNARRTLTIEKVNLNNGGNGDPNEMFTGTYSGPVSGAFSVSVNSPFSVSVPLGTYTITEDPPAGSTYVGGFTYLDERFLCNAVDAPEEAVAGPVAIGLVAAVEDFPRHVCLVNARRTLTIEKVNLNNGGNGDPNEMFTGTYSGPVSGAFSVSVNSPFSVSVPLGTYTITEDPPAGATYVGGFTYLDERFLCNAVDAPDEAVAGPVVVGLGAAVEDFPRHVCLVNARRTLTIEKVNLGGSPDQLFTGTYSGPVNGTFSVSQNLPFSVSVPLGTYTITEDTLSGSSYVGGFSFLDERFLCNAVEAPGRAVAGPVAISLAEAVEDFPRHVCLVNQAVSEVEIIKHDDVDTAHGGNTGQWAFAVSGTAGPDPVNTTLFIGRSDGTVQNATQQFGPVSTTGTVTELAGNATACTDQIVKTYQTSVGSPGNLGTVANFSSVPGTAANVDFYNIDCGKILGAGTLDVFKVNDLDGSKTQESGEAALTWEVTVSCPGQPDLVATTPAHFTGLPNNTTCTVTESPAASYRVIGWRARDIGTASGQVDSDGIGVSATVHVDDGDRLTVTFYNQPRVNVRVHKSEILTSGAGNGQGWAITLTGCGVDQTFLTGADGNATFSDLPPCTFTVSEKPDSKSGFVPAGPTSTQLTVTAAGQTATAGFTNVSLAGLCAVCGSPSVITTPTPSPTPVSTPPAATTPTSTATSTSLPSTPTTAPATSAPAPALSPSPTLSTGVAGDRPPGSLSVTPAAPRTGSGASGAPGGPATQLAMLGGLLLAFGGAGLIAARRR